MSLQDLLKSKLDRLINIMLTDGVQPSDFADNISLDCYKKISYYKLNDNIIGELTISEEQNIDTVLRYVYNSSMRLMRIEEESLGVTKIEWDRNESETELINEIVEIIQTQYTDEQMSNFLNSLPENIKDKIKSRFKEVA